MNLIEKGTGIATVRTLSNPKSEEPLSVRSWRLDKYNIEIVLDAPRIMQTAQMRLSGEASRNVLNLRFKSRYWDQTILLMPEAVWRDALSRSQ